MNKDYYEILGITKDASEDEIKKAYRKLAAEYHPDVSKDPKANEKMALINEAYATLKDPDKRANYDQYGSNEDMSYNYNPSNNNYEYSSGYVYVKSPFAMGRFIIGIIFILLVITGIWRLIEFGRSIYGNNDVSSEHFKYSFYSGFYGNYLYVKEYSGTDKEVVIEDYFMVRNHTYRVVGIGDSAFKGNTTMDSISISPSILEIDANAFKGCTSLKSVIFRGTKAQYNEWIRTVTIVKTGNSILTDILSDGNVVFSE